MINKFFLINKRGSDVKTEISAGISCFTAMAYIIFINPIILSAAGMPKGAVFVATAVSAGLSTIFMGLYANMPFALAPGMGINAFFAYYIAKTLGFGWEQGLALVLISGLIFLVISFTSFRKWIIASIPQPILIAMGVGIGGFIIFVGLKNAGIIGYNPATLVTLGSLATPKVILAFIGIMLVFGFYIKGFKGFILYGVIITTAIGFIWNLVNPAKGLPQMPIWSYSDFSDVGIVFGKAWQAIPQVLGNPLAWTLIIILLFMNFFGTIAVATNFAQDAGLTNEKGECLNMKKVLVVDAAGTVIGATVGTSTVVTYIESGVGIISGGKTGLVSVVVGILFLLSLFLYPFLNLITPAVTTAALVMVGILMAARIKLINFEDKIALISAWVVIITMIMAFDIAMGIVFGFIVYTFLMLIAGRSKELNYGVYFITAYSLLYLFLTIK